MSQKGFSIVEIVVATIILILLMTITATMYDQMESKARDARRVTDMGQMIKGLGLFFHDEGSYPNSDHNISNTGEMIGDDRGPLEQALESYITPISADPLHDGTEYYYAYDFDHEIDTSAGSCDAAGGKAAVLGFQKAETDVVPLKKQTCSGNDMNLDVADYNLVLYPKVES